MSALDNHTINTPTLSGELCPRPDDCEATKLAVDKLIARRDWNMALAFLDEHTKQLDLSQCNDARIWLQYSLIYGVISPDHPELVAEFAERASQCPNWTSGMRHDMQRDALLTELRTAKFDAESIRVQCRHLIEEALSAKDHNRTAAALLVLLILSYREGDYSKALEIAIDAQNEFNELEPDLRNEQWMMDLRFHELLALARRGSVFRTRRLFAIEISRHDRSRKRARAAWLIAIGGASGASLVEWYANRGTLRK